MVERTYGQLYLEVRDALLKTDDPQTAAYTARQVICHFSGLSPDQVVARRDETVPKEIRWEVRAATDRLLAEEPLAYVLGEWEFYGLPLYVTKDVLIPRDDTCAVTELAIRNALFLDKDPRILDLCCGSGCIGLAVASRVVDARVTLADLSQEALAVAKKNLQRNKFGGRVSCIRADALSEPPAFLGKFDMIISNPPYITGQEMRELPRSVGEYEPEMALFGGEDGLDFYRSIARNYASVLKPGGYLAFEFGMGQGDDVCQILTDNGYTVLERTRDYNDRERAVIAIYGRKDR